ncbi:NUDIX hydrolase [Nocardioides sp. GY 10113]|uniref:NUDIX domain-containing protein n=1 Tax=Nocardioides sp. GY 10113 TaxID=2569761 RepID=UPI0010A81F2A|nr:NUDIX hydrolase [Nocardioides sp. GY 10113]TIC79164.1 NUDIX hydrolase [Nocardioides sp. GY 10113]
MTEDRPQGLPPVLGQHLAQDLADSWPVLESTEVFRSGWVVALRADLVDRPGADDEAPFRRYVVEHPGAVVVLAIDAQDRVLVQRQYRHATGHRLIELPAGVRDHPGEDPVEVARRELLEEAGVSATEWTPLLSTFSSPGYTEERLHFFLARGLTSTGRDGFEPEHEEAELETFWVPFEELVERVLDGSIADGPTVQAVLAHAAARRRTG